MRIGELILALSGLLARSRPTTVEDILDHIQAIRDACDDMEEALPGWRDEGYDDELYALLQGSRATITVSSASIGQRLTHLWRLGAQMDTTWREIQDVDDSGEEPER